MRRIRWWIWILLGAFGLAAAVVVLVLSEPVQTAIVHRLIGDFNNRIQGSLSIGSVQVDVAGLVSLHDVRLRDTDGTEVLSFAAMRARVDLWGLRHQEARVYQLRIDSLRMSVIMDTSGGSNLQHALAPKQAVSAAPETTKSAPWAFSLDRMRVGGGPILIRSATDTLLNVAACTLRGKGQLRNQRLTYSVEYDAPQQLNLKAEGAGVLSKPLRELRGNVSLRVDSNYTGGYYGLPTNRFGRLTAELDFQQHTDSIGVQISIGSTTLGTLHGETTVTVPPKDFAGHGDFAFENLKPSAMWRDTTDLELNGTLEFVKAAAPAMVNGWDVQLRLVDTRYADYRIHASELQIVTKDSTVTVRGNVDTGRGRIGIDAMVDGLVPEEMSVRGDLRLSELDLHRLVSQVPDSLSPLTGTVSVSGERLASASGRQATMTASLSPFTFGQYRVDTLALRAAMNGKHITLDTLVVHGYGVALDGEAEGELRGNVDYTVRAEIPDLRAAEPLLAVVSDSLDSLRGAVTLDLHGSVDLSESTPNVNAQGEVSLREASYDKTYVKNADIRVTQFDQRTMTFGAMIKADSLVAGGRRIDSADVRVSGDREQFATVLSVWAEADSTFIGAKFTTRREGPTTVIALDSLHARAFGMEAVSESPTTVSISRDRMAVDALQIRSDVGVLRASGYLQRHGDQDITVEVSGLRTGALADVLKKPLPASTANVRVQFTGTDTDLVGDLSVAADSIVYDRKLVADHVVVEATANDKVTTVTGMVAMLGDTSAVFEGEIPLRISFGSGVVLHRNDPMSGHVKIFEQRLAGFSQFFSSSTSIDGFMAGEVTFKGTPADPQWQGRFSVRDATYRDGRTGVNYRDLDLEGELVGDTLRIPRFSMRSVGRVDGEGSALMAFPLPKELTLRLHMDRFEIMNSAQLRVRTSGDVNVTGPFNSLRAEGNLKFDEIIYLLSAASMKRIEEVNIDSVLAVMRGDTAAAKEAPFSPTAIYRSMSMELHLDIPGNCWIRGNGMNIELGGELWMYKDNGIDPTISGSIQTRQGKVDILTRRFDVTSGQISFEGPIDDPQIDVMAEYNPPDQSTATQRFKVHIFGTVKQTQMEFEGMSAEEAILALFPQGSGGFEQTATGAATGQLTSFVGKWAGLDVLEYRPGSAGGNLTGGTLEVGSYVTDRLFVRVRQPVESGAAGQTGRVVNVEYRLQDWLKVRAEQDVIGGTQGSALDLILQFDWR